MPLDRRALAFPLVVALVAAACGGAAATATPASTPAASEAPAASGAPASEAPASEAAASSEPASSGNGAGLGLPGLPGSAPDLEAMLPSNVGGVAFQRTSFGGGALPATIPVGTDQLGTFLKDSGKTLADLSFAMATPTDTSKAGTFVMAFQVKGADGTKLAEALAGSSSSDLQTATVGGKQVQQSGAAGMGFTLYVKGDVVFYILAFGDASLANAIVAALP
jgi:hypothetical protein